MTIVVLKLFAGRTDRQSSDDMLAPLRSIKIGYMEDNSVIYRVGLWLLCIVFPLTAIYL